MKTLFFAWVGHKDRELARSSKDGPIAVVLSQRDFDEAHLLHTLPAPDGDAAAAEGREAEAFRAWTEVRARGRVGRVVLHLVVLPDPTDYRGIHDAVERVLRGVLERHGPDVGLTFHTSPGTPQMTATWMLIASSRYPGAELVQTHAQRGTEILRVDFPYELHARYVADHAGRTSRDWVGRALESFAAIAHASPAMRNVVEAAARFAPFQVPVLLEGPSGTGKELLAQAVHRASPRSKAPFRSVNCAAVVSSLAESEIFGHVRGAFTGADKDRAGVFEECDGGTVFLDEIGEAPLELQAKFLRVLQNGEIQKVGSADRKIVDVRIVAATNRNLLEEVEVGRFREDLYYRLAVGLVSVPPLASRREDVPALIRAFLDEANFAFAAQSDEYVPRTLSGDALAALVAAPWPGNVRELQNTIRRLVLWCPRPDIGAEDVQAQIVPARRRAGNVYSRPLGHGFRINDLVAHIERHYLERALAEADGNKEEAARLLGLGSGTTVGNWIERLGRSGS